MCPEEKVIQSCGSVFVAQGGVADKIPAWVEGDALVLGWLGAVVSKYVSSRGCNMNPETHFMVNIVQVIQVRRF